MHWSQRLAEQWLRRGVVARALLPLAWLFGLVAALRRVLYRRGLLASHEIGVPVIVIGNLVAGGAGKTPTVLAVVQALRAHGYRPAIVSRGHGRKAVAPLEITPDTAPDLAGDEPLLLARRGGVPLAVGRDRVAAARLLCARHPEVDVVVSDDGLQHLALARDLQVIVFDDRGCGNGWLLPAGPLREPLPTAPPARTLVLYNARRPSTPLPGWLARQSLSGVCGLAQWHSGAVPTPAGLASLRGRPLVAAAGIAQPARFFALLAAEGLEATPLPLPDHHDFASLGWPEATPNVIVTEKDAVKLAPGRTGGAAVWVAALDLQPDPAFVETLIAQLPPPRSRHGNPPA